MSIYLSLPSIALGSEERPVVESAAAGRLMTSGEDLERAGFSVHHVASATQSAYDLAIEAVSQLHFHPETVDLLIHAVSIPENARHAMEPTNRIDVKTYMDYAGSHLQTALGLRKAALLGLTEQACTGALGMIRIAHGLLQAEEHLESALCIAADRFPDGTTYEQGYNVISDGAAACLVHKAEDAFRIRAFHHITNGALVKADDDETVGTYFSQTVRCIEELCAREGCTPASIDWIIPQNTNSSAWIILARLLGISQDRILQPTTASTGHAISADCLINLRHAHEQGCFKAGDTVLLTMAGYGANWQALLLEVVREAS